MIHEAPNCPVCGEVMRFHYIDVSSMDRRAVATQWVCEGMDGKGHWAEVIAVGDEQE